MPALLPGADLFPASDTYPSAGAAEGALYPALDLFPSGSLFPSAGGSSAGVPPYRAVLTIATRPTVTIGIQE